jgi:hypothetical protein
MTKPRPKHTIVCDICELPWADHEDAVWAEEDIHDPITTATCVKLMKKANQGPMGPVGPMGPAGMNGRDGKDGAHGLPGRPYPYAPYTQPPGTPYPGTNPITWGSLTMPKEEE